MSDLTKLTALELSEKLGKKEISAVEVTKAHFERIENLDNKVKSFLYLDKKGALSQAEDIDKARKDNKSLNKLAGVPLALKDVLTQKDVPTTCGSKILENWRPPYDSTVVKNLRNAGVVILGKTNMDEFAMGSSTENSAYFPTRNPWDLNKIPGGSSGGSSAAVAAFFVPLSIGTDTGGSIRQPASVTGIVGAKPSYGAVSRYGLVAFASSLDQAGPFARTVLDCAMLHEVMAGHDPLDSTSINEKVPDVVKAAKTLDVKGMKIGYIKELGGSGWQTGVINRFKETIETLKSLGAIVTEISIPHSVYALATYYLIAPSEASSNLARFDGMRYGLRVDDQNLSAEEVMNKTRAKGFGKEVKRRIMIGTYALSSGYYDAYYAQAQKVRALIAQDLKNAFTEVDVLISPTSPTTAWGLGERVNDPLAMYLADLATLPPSLAGIPAMSIPIGLADEDKLPVGLQIIAPFMQDDRMYKVAGTLEASLKDKWNRLLIDSIPDLKVASHG